MTKRLVLRQERKERRGRGKDGLKVMCKRRAGNSAQPSLMLLKVLIRVLIGGAPRLDLILF